MTADAQYSTAVLGAYFLGAVYLAGLIAAGLAWGNHWAVKAALISAGCGYIVQVGAAFAATNVKVPPSLIAIFWGLSVAAAIAGGLLLLGA